MPLVGMCPNGDLVMFKHILIPTDGSELATKVIPSGIALAKAVGAKVTVEIERSRSRSRFYR